MANIQQTKYALRIYIQKHNLPYRRMVLTLPVWGSAAKRNTRTLTKAKGRTVTDTFAAAESLLFPDTLAQLVVKRAKAEVGVTEQPAGSNTGPRVKVYQSVTGAYYAPWCASFVCWCYRKAGYKGKLPPLPAYVPSWTQVVKGRQNGWRPISFRYAKAGDIVCLWNSGHIEIVMKRDGDYLSCIGGNTSPVGQASNGGMVAKTKRHRSEVTVIGRYK